MSDILSKLQKLRALAERGIGGEKANASRMLEKLLAESGFTEADLDQDSVEWHPFRIRAGKLQRKLFVQVVCQVTDKEEAVIPTIERKLWVKCTKSQAIEIRLRYSVFGPCLDADLYRMFRAFVQKNKIFAPSGESVEDTRPAAERQMDAFLQFGASVAQVRKQLETTKP